MAVERYYSPAIGVRRAGTSTAVVASHCAFGRDFRPPGFSFTRSETGHAFVQAARVGSRSRRVYTD